MIPDEPVARRAIFGALRPDEDGLAWQLVTANGEPLHVIAPEQLLISSSEQYVTIPPETEASEEPTAGPTGAMGGTPATTPSGGPPEPGPVHYRVHDLTVTNRSLTDHQSREQLFQLIRAIADALDPTSRVDLQVANIRIELNAAAGDLDHLADKASEAGAEWSTSDEDFLDTRDYYGGSLYRTGMSNTALPRKPVTGRSQHLRCSTSPSMKTLV